MSGPELGLVLPVAPGESAADVSHRALALAGLVRPHAALELLLAVGRELDPDALAWRDLAAALPELKVHVFTGRAGPGRRRREAEAMVTAPWLMRDTLAQGRPRPPEDWLRLLLAWREDAQPPSPRSDGGGLEIRRRAGTPP